ncbi:hypothetical protein [Bombilactobacillus thymidiniphilus]|uniref:Uncharacterized protein n=1 Tax=Bombilactobacillus thymidiniphilus TaxID=2923363 RepID=A0ABY4PD76_9LACO|nr:hypothetical protein [Bombilactobacillus thymidiniphilus]UQS83666.1 hypothetical protein MOO47_00240 [Bombilactobacillus thymidiniphilus]
MTEQVQPAIADEMLRLQFTKDQLMSDPQASVAEIQQINQAINNLKRK